jgi:subtilisin-like proprotein convertase family protein
VGDGPRAWYYSRAKASPYPDQIEIAGLTDPITSVEVTLHQVSHPKASDIDILLVGPDGQRVLLMSDVAHIQ